MDGQTLAGRVLQMRLVVEAPDYEDAVSFYPPTPHRSR
jgi:hypothetical protein